MPTPLALLLSILSLLLYPTAANAGDCWRHLVAETRAKSAVDEIFRAAGVPAGALTVNDDRFYARLLSDPELQIGETYVDGLWDSPAVDQLSAQLLSSQRRLGRWGSLRAMWRVPGLAASAIWRDSYRNLRDGLTNRQTRARSTAVAKEHYDVGNELYRQMLDPTMTYTSGLWAPGYTLEDAQNAKYDLIARKLGLQPGQRVLDIGAGFGGFARFAAKHYGAEVTGISISVEQLKVARALSAGMPGVNFLYSDYRDLPARFPPGSFDHVVSIEMIEAVGTKNLGEFFRAAHAGLKEGGRFVVQHIASHADVVNSNPWFAEYIFKDGVAPSANQVDRAAEKTFGRPVDRQPITADYDRTLLAWHANFTAAWPKLRPEYGDRFKRLWDFYLLSVAGAFRVDHTHVFQSTYVKGGAEATAGPRSLPTPEGVQSMRATPAEKERAAGLIAALEAEKKRSAAARARPLTPAGRLASSARIAVVGAGPAGLSAAEELRRLGYENVVVFEKEDAAGGKSHTVEFAARPHDLGATMGVKIKYAEVERLAAEAGQATVPFPKEVNYSLTNGGPERPAGLGANLRFAYQGLLYLLRYRKLGGPSERFERPAGELADPWPIVMNRHGLGEFGERMKTYLTGYGYGGPDTPAVFGMRMLDPGAILGAALSRPIMWEHGTQPIWKALAAKLGVRVGTPVLRIERDAGGVTLYPEGQPAERFDNLVMAVDPRLATQLLDVTEEEASLFAKVRHTPYATFAVWVEGFAEGRSEVGYLRENMTLEREGHPMAWIKRYADDDIFVFHLFAPPALSDDEIMSKIREDLQRLGARRLELLASRRWPFFPHVDAEAMRESEFFERFANLQGQNHTIYINEALGMSTMPDSVAQAQSTVRRWVNGLRF